MNCVEISVAKEGDAIVFVVPASIYINQGQAQKLVDPKGESVLLYSTMLQAQEAIERAGFSVVLPKHFEEYEDIKPRRIM